MTPLFVCMPLWVDCTFFDIVARSVLRGERIYHDLFLHGPPGMILVTAGLRWLIGWRSESLRVIDWFIVTGIILLITEGPWRRGRLAGHPGTILVMLLFYLSTTEWCHCQSDMWMLLPAVVGLRLRCGQMHRLAGRHDTIVPWAVLEGLVWALAVFIKPFAVFAAGACWLMSVVIMSKTKVPIARIGQDLAGIVTGAGTVAAASILWLVLSGNWDGFMSAACSDWNRDYYATSPPLWWRLRQVLRWFWPWSLIHVSALPIALAWIWRALRSPRAENRARPLIAAVFVAWLLQATLLQKQLIYQMTPTVLLGLAIVAAAWNEWPWWMYLRGRRWAVGHLAAVCFLLAAVLSHPIWRMDRLALWSRCWSEGSTAELRDALALQDDKAATRWADLARVQAFLAEQNLRGKELTCLSVSTTPLYWQMDLSPSTRFVLLEPALGMFRNHAEQIRNELRSSAQRFMVSDLRQLNLTAEEAAVEIAGDPLALPPLPDRPLTKEAMADFPMDVPVVFRSGRYLVHVCQPLAARRSKLGSTVSRRLVR
jgi:hypothetical protein